MQKAKDVKSDDSTPDELKDVKEFYAKPDHKVNSLKHLLKELKEQRFCLS